MATPDGATVAGQPEVVQLGGSRSTTTCWIRPGTPSTSRCRRIRVVANGFLTGRETKRGWTTYEWDAREPMASYLATIDIGFWDVHKWRTDTASGSMTRSTPQLQAGCGLSSIRLLGPAG